MSHLFDPDLLERLERMGGERRCTTLWRVVWNERNPLLGSSGGRWSKRDGPRVIYCSESSDGALAEVYYHLSKAPVFSSAEKQLYQFSFTCENALNLSNKATLEALGITQQMLVGRDPSAAQEIGAAAHFLEYDALIVPSARWDSNNIVTFEDRLDSTSFLEAIDCKPINYPAWREQAEIARRLKER